MSDVQLSADESRLFEKFYQRRLAEAGGARDDAQELEIARDILMAAVNDGLTPTADGGASYVRRGAVDWSDPATIQAAQTTAGQGERGRLRSPKSKGTSKELLQGVVIIAVAIAAVAWFLWPKGKEIFTPPKSPLFVLSGFVILNIYNSVRLVCILGKDCTFPFQYSLCGRLLMDILAVYHFLRRVEVDAHISTGG